MIPGTGREYAQALAVKADALGDFLRARRDHVRPEDVGLVPGGRRRAPGLRREELAMLAGISFEYHLRLEQGRDKNPSGLYGRADLAVLNLAQYPAILVECGNMKNGDEAAQMEGPDGRAKYAAAVTQGIVTYLSGKAPAS